MFVTKQAFSIQRLQRYLLLKTFYSTNPKPVKAYRKHRSFSLSIVIVESKMSNDQSIKRKQPTHFLALRLQSPALWEHVIKFLRNHK